MHYSLAAWTSYNTFTIHLNYVLYTQPNNLCVNLSNYHTQPTFRRNSIAHAQPIFRHNSLHHILAEWTSYITFTHRLNFILHTQPTSRTISNLHSHPILRNKSLHHSLAEWTSYITFTCRLNFILHTQPTFRKSLFYMHKLNFVLTLCIQDLLNILPKLYLPYVLTSSYIHKILSAQSLSYMHNQ